MAPEPVKGLKFNTEPNIFVKQTTEKSFSIAK